MVSGISVIILGRSRPWGVLAAHSTTRRRFSDDDVNFLQATANVMADAIGRMEVEGELRAAHDLERSLRKRLQRVQDMSLDLRPAGLDDLGLHPALLWLVRYCAQTGVAVALQCSGLDGPRRPEVETAAYRIVQEGLTNVARHVGVIRATVECALTGNALRVEVADEGIGFDVEAIPSGKISGLAGMQERARSAGGRLSLRTEPGRGTTVVAEFPDAFSETE